MRSASSVLLRTQSDARLVALASVGHDSAFEAIVERYRRPLLRACRRILPEAGAEDALQLALVSAWTALRRGDEVRELRPWLYRIVRNTALNQLRVTGQDLDELVGTLAAAASPQEEIERRALVHRTLAAVAALPDRQRDALLRTAIEGQGQDEVARDLGLSSNAVRQLVHRARTSVRMAATAVMPFPLATWLATAGTRGEPMGQRIAELVAAGAAGGSAWAAKAGTVAVLAGGAVTAPAVIDHPEDRDTQPADPSGAAPAEAAGDPAAPRGEPQPVPAVSERRRPVPDADAPRVEERAEVSEKPRKPEPHTVAGQPDVAHRGGGDDPPHAAERVTPPAPTPSATPVPSPVATPSPTPSPSATPVPTPVPTPDEVSEETGDDGEDDDTTDDDESEAGDDGSLGDPLPVPPVAP